MAELSRATMSLGVPFGAHRENQVERYAPGTPASSTVGMPGAFGTFSHSLGQFLTRTAGVRITFLVDRLTLRRLNASEFSHDLDA
jgi:hypothetical protein